MNLVELIRDFVSSLDLSGEVIALSDDATDTTLTLENSFHLRKGMSIRIDSTDYDVLSVNSELDTVVVSGVIANASTYKVPNPKFYHGTHYLLNAERSYFGDEIPGFLMVRSGRRIPNEDSTYSTVANFKWLLLDNANYEDWSSDDYVELRLQGLDKLVDKIVESARTYRKFGRIDGEFNIEPDYKFGVQVDKKGAVNSLFNNFLTGVMITVSIPIKKCKC